MRRNRRRVICAGMAAVGGLVAGFGARAQAASSRFRIGVLGSQDAPAWDGLRQGLRDLGYVEGHNLLVEWRWSKGRADRYPALAADLVALEVDLIVTSGTQAARAAKTATTSIPIVMATSAYPDRLGLVDSLARPGGNVTGMSNIAPDLFAKRVDLLREVVPSLSRLAAIMNPSSPVEPLGLAQLEAAATAAGILVELIAVRTPDDFPAAFAALSVLRPNGLMAFGNPVNFLGRARIAAYSLEHRIPGIFQERQFVQAGGLMSYSPSFIDQFRLAATFVDKILNGARPADLPVQQPARLELVINLKTAKAMGLTIPDAVLLRADRLID